MENKEFGLIWESNELKVIGSEKNELQSLIILVNLISEIKEVSLFCEIQIDFKYSTYLYLFFFFFYVLTTTLSQAGYHSKYM